METVTNVCGTVYHSPNQRAKTFTCVLPEGHEGAHNDSSNNIGFSKEDTSSLGAIEREIKRDLMDRR